MRGEVTVACSLNFCHNFHYFVPMDYQGHEVREKELQAELAAKWDDFVAEADTCLHAIETYLQELGIEVLSSMTHPEPKYFTVCVRLSDNFSLAAINRIYLEEDLDLYRFIHLEHWTLLDHVVLARDMSFLDGENGVPLNPKKDRPNSYSGRLSKLIPQWRELEKDSKSMSYV